jgi:hypothetical protein
MIRVLQTDVIDNGETNRLPVSATPAIICQEFLRNVANLPPFSAAVVIHTSEMPTDCDHLCIRRQ